ncbi:MAG: hypothetical protein AB1698_01610 [Pseudomonadota bacterium]
MSDHVTNVRLFILGLFIVGMAQALLACTTTDPHPDLWKGVKHVLEQNDKTK